MSRHGPETDSSNEGSGTDSEEDQKADDMSSHSHSQSSSASDTGSESEATESRFMVTKNNDVGDKRPREEAAAADPANKKPKNLGGKLSPAFGNKVDASQMKASPVNRNVAGPKATIKKVIEPKKQTDSDNNNKQQQQVKKKEGEKEPTPKKTPQVWSSEDEHTLVLNIFKDMKAGMKPPKRGIRGDNYHYWGDLHEACQGKFISDWSKDQLYDKYRRMKLRYDGMVEKERAEGITSLKFKNVGEEKIYSLWKQMYEMQEQEEADPKPDSNKKTTPAAAAAATTPVQQQRKDVHEDEAAKKDVASSSKKSKAPVAPPKKRSEEGKQNGAASGTEAGGDKAVMGFAGAVQEMQKKYNAEFGEMRRKFDQLMSELHARGQGLAAEGGRGDQGLLSNGMNDWLMLSMAARGSSPLFGMEMFGGLGGSWSWIGGITDVKLKEHWLKQQEEELRVMEQRFRLMQELCQHQQELLKK